VVPVLYHWLTAAAAVLWNLERARVTERLGDREKAARNYQYVDRHLAACRS
jgi:hypothetical protein